MKKVLVTVATIVAFGTTAWFMQPEQPMKYQLHVVTYGETMESIVKDSNKNVSVDYDIRDAVATAVAESSKMEGGATSRQLKVGDRIAVPIYR
nr:MAG TPA: hypothetical protein [Bacteriophage sp.]